MFITFYSKKKSPPFGIPFERDCSENGVESPLPLTSNARFVSVCQYVLCRLHTEKSLRQHRCIECLSPRGTLVFTVETSGIFTVEFTGDPVKRARLRFFPQFVLGSVW